MITETLRTSGRPVLPASGADPDLIPQGTRLGGVLRDARLLFGRNLLHLRRNPEQLVVAIVLPTGLLLMFRFMFGGAIDTGTTYVNYLISGIIVIGVTLNATSTATAVAYDLTEGIVDRFRSMPMVGATVLVGHVGSAVVRSAISVAALVGVGLLLGFRPEAGIAQWTVALGLLLLVAAAISTIGGILGLLARSVDGAAGLSFAFVFLPYASSAFVPTETLPSGLRGFVENQPLTVAIDAVRALFMGLPLGNAGWLAALWWLGILTAAIPLAGWLFRRRATR